MLFLLLLPVLLILGTAGCGTFMAHRLVQAPNTYPDWFAPEAPVLLGFSPRFLTNFPKQFVEVGPPEAKLCYRVIEPAGYHLKISSTNWTEHGKTETEFDFHADIPGPTNLWTSAPRGTVILLHGYGLAQFSMVPWALQLAGSGWRCVLVDLRGHGKSTGKKIYYGIKEVHDLSQLLDQLERDGNLKEPVAAMGESYGAVMVLRWKMADVRVGPVVAIAPYASLSNAVMNLRQEYADWMPKWMLRDGLNQLPVVLGLTASELNTTTALAQNSVGALFVAGGKDKIMPAADVEQLTKLAGRGSEFILVPDATHETVTYYLADLAPPVLAWLTNQTDQNHSAGTNDVLTIK
jgi:pimeloyl-ACP methyl ester carboxylesterase